MLVDTMANKYVSEQAKHFFQEFSEYAKTQHPETLKSCSEKLIIFKSLH